MKDIELAKLFALPTSTIADWKSKKNLNGNVKFLLYKFISSLPDELVRERIEAIKLIEDIEVVGRNEFIKTVLNNAEKFDIFDGYEIPNPLTKPTGLESLNLGFKDMWFLKNRDNEYIALHFYIQNQMSTYSYLDRMRKAYEIFHEHTKIKNIYLITSGVNPQRVQSREIFEGFHKLIVLDANYFTSKLYKRKNIVFWNEANAS
ncbi:MAG TPA: hypothetical protein CFH82_07470 [Sulfurospirillum sp. UBA12182]|nr:MAG TPA: hypothetical protein CFH82_07470 [Sulfurospirillum sp. UBA12182]